MASGQRPRRPTRCPGWATSQRPSRRLRLGETLFETMATVSSHPLRFSSWRRTCWRRLPHRPLSWTGSTLELLKASEWCLAKGSPIQSVISARNYVKPPDLRRERETVNQRWLVVLSMNRGEELQHVRHRGESRRETERCVALPIPDGPAEPFARPVSQRNCRDRAAKSWPAGRGVRHCGESRRETARCVAFGGRNLGLGLPSRTRRCFPTVPTHAPSSSVSRRSFSAQPRARNGEGGLPRTPGRRKWRRRARHADLTHASSPTRRAKGFTSRTQPVLETTRIASTTAPWGHRSKRRSEHSR